MAAEAFAKGASAKKIDDILTGGFCLNMGEAEEVMSQALPHRSDRDGGYKAFLSSVNNVIGEDVYQIRHHDEKRAA
jgi:hypothetical protein